MSAIKPVPSVDGMKLLRRLLVLALALVVVAVLALVAFVVVAPISTVGHIDFDQRLKIPPLAKSHVEADGTRVFDLSAQEGTTELLPG